jgi:hypothetical protein
MREDAGRKHEFVGSFFLPSPIPKIQATAVMAWTIEGHCFHHDSGWIRFGLNIGVLHLRCRGKSMSGRQVKASRNLPRAMHRNSAFPTPLSAPTHEIPSTIKFSDLPFLERPVDTVLRICPGSTIDNEATRV